ncbi:MAG: cell division protein FtsA [Verrucomicrobiales bacterium]|nr:cell division protein FtsA [Verrucomicrobiales bacterium]
MASSNIYAGLEIGTSKVCLVVGEVRSDGALRILGVGQHPSAGVRKGEVVDSETVQACLHDALVRAEERSDVEINTVFLSVSGAHIQGVNSRGAIRVPDGEIGPEDLDEVKKKCREVQVPSENGFIHSIIQHYYVDGQAKIVNPVGMLGQKLEADYHIIHGIKTRIQNSIKCVREVPLEVEDIVFAPVASAQVVLDRETKNRGALLLDIGGGTTDYICFVDGAVVASGSVGIGGDHITNDIALVLKVPLARAEKLKVTYGSAWLDGINPAEKVPIAGEGSETVDRLLICQIINARLNELLTLINNSLAFDNILGKTAGGVYLTGGSSLLTGLDDLVSDTFGLPVYKGGSSSMSGPSALFENPQYATPVGLIRYAQLLNEQRPRAGAISKIGRKFEKIFGLSR